MAVKASKTINFSCHWIYELLFDVVCDTVSSRVPQTRAKTGFSDCGTGRVGTRPLSCVTSFTIIKITLNVAVNLFLRCNLSRTHKRSCKSHLIAFWWYFPSVFNIVFWNYAEKCETGSFCCGTRLDGASVPRESLRGFSEAWATNCT